ncbi:uncharacterized protein J3R85_016380 [Psidium guajava]|nr:uncharacterized protein J3R85_016380 [Psidium guajava]
MTSNAILVLEDQGGSVSKPIGKSLPSGLGRSLSVRVKRLVKAKSSCKVASPTENPGLPGKEAPKEQRDARKTRRLSQVETPEALKKATRKRKAMATELGGRNGGKVKRLSEVKTPEGFNDVEKKKKTKKTAAMHVKRESSKRGSSSKPAAKKGSK